MGMIKIPNRSIKYFKENLDEVFESGNLAEGPWNKKIEKYIETLTGATKALATNSNGSGSVALLSLYKYCFGRDLVLLQSNTMYGVKTWIPASGCIVQGFIDCQPTTLMPSSGDVLNALSLIKNKDKSRLIILLSHIGGIINPDIEEIAKVCKKENIILIEDCAHSFGATLNNKHSGLFGDAGVYSFYATKAIPAGEGGIVITKNKELGSMIADFSIYDRFKQKLEIGNNIRISEVQALFTYSILKEWKVILRNKSTIANEYINICEKYDIKYIAQDKSGHNGNYYKFIILSNSGDIKEDFPLLKSTTSPVYDYFLGSSDAIIKCHACLPIWYGQENSITDKVIKELSSHY